MPHSKLGQPVWLLAAVALLVAVIVIASLYHFSIQSGLDATIKESTALSAKRVPDGAASTHSQSAPRSPETISSQGAHTTVSGAHSLDASNDPAPQTTQNESSDEQRAVAAFHRSWQCHVASSQIKSLQSQIAACDALGSAMDDICGRNIKQAEADIQVETARLAGCGTVPAVLEKAYFDSVTRAAELGDSDAQVCFIQGDFFNELGRQQMEQYKDDARNYIQMGLERGDWRVVSLLATHSVDYSGRLGELALDNPYDILRMNRLLRHGATGEYAQILDSNARDSTIRLDNKAQVDAAIAWAQQEYERYFRNSPKLHSEPGDCSEVELYEGTSDQ